MSRRNSIRASLALIAAGFAFGATGAGAMPIRDGTPPAKDAAKLSLAQERSAAVAAQQAQVLAEAQGISRHADLRGADAKDAAIRGQRPDAHVPVQGLPVFSSAARPAQPLPSDDGGNDVPLVGFILGLTGAGILGAGAAVAVTRTGRSRRAPVA